MSETLEELFLFGEEKMEKAITSCIESLVLFVQAELIR